jgi:hypothetical protein
MLKALTDLGHLENKGLSRAAALEQMRGRPGWYDPRILHAISEVSWFAPDPPEAGREGPRAVTFANLRIGQVLAADLETRDSVLIVSAGNRITPPLLERLRNFATLTGIKEPIHVED